MCRQPASKQAKSVLHTSVVSDEELTPRRDDNGKYQRCGNDLGIKFQFIQNDHTRPRTSQFFFFRTQSRLIAHIEFGRIFGKGLGNISRLLLQTKDGCERHLLIQFLLSQLGRCQDAGRSVGADRIGFRQASDLGDFGNAKVSERRTPTQGTGTGTAKTTIKVGIAILNGRRRRRRWW